MGYNSVSNAPVNGETWEYLIHAGFAHAQLGNMELVNTFLKISQPKASPWANTNKMVSPERAKHKKYVHQKT